MSETVSSLFSPSLPSSFYRLLDSERDSGRRASTSMVIKGMARGGPDYREEGKNGGIISA